MLEYTVQSLLMTINARAADFENLAERLLKIRIIQLD